MTKMAELNTQSEWSEKVSLRRMHWAKLWKMRSQLDEHLGMQNWTQKEQ
jgi:hypothetical protein